MVKALLTVNCGFVSVEIPDNCIEAIPRYHCALEDFFFNHFTPTAKLNSGFSANLYFHKIKCVSVFSASLGVDYQSESCLAKFTARNIHKQRLRRMVPLKDTALLSCHLCIPGPPRFCSGHSGLAAGAGWLILPLVTLFIWL